MSDARPRRWLAYLRVALLLFGVAAMVALVRRVGPATVAGALLSAGPFVPLLVALEAAWMGMDVFVLRALLGTRARQASWSVWARSAVTVYPVTILFPAGRATAEATRAAMLAPYLGAPATGFAAIQIQGSSLLGSASISLLALAVIIATIGAHHRLTAAVGISAILLGLMGIAILFGSRTEKSRALVRRFLPLGAVELATADPTSRPLVAVALSFVGRALQAVFFTCALFATTGQLSPRFGIIAQSIAVAGSTFGDVVPQQAGVTEGAFAYFADTIGLGNAPEKALATVLLMRACQIMLTGIAFLIGFAWRRATAARSPAVSDGG